MNEQKELENEFRKNLKELEMSTLDAVIILSKCFETLMMFCIRKYGRKFRAEFKKACELDNEMSRVMDFYFHAATHIVLPFLNMNLDMLERIKDQINKELDAEE